MSIELPGNQRLFRGIGKSMSTLQGGSVRILRFHHPKHKKDRERVGLAVEDSWNMQHPRLVIAITQHFDNVLSKSVLDFTMPGNGLRYFRPWILIPIMFTTVANKDAAHFFKPFYQISPFHVISSSATRRTLGIFPLVNSL